MDRTGWSPPPGCAVILNRTASAEVCSGDAFALTPINTGLIKNGHDSLMNCLRYMTILLALMLTMGMNGDDSDSEPSYDIHYHNRLTAQLLVDMFFQKIDQGELAIFEHILTREMLQPTQIAYVYQLDNNTSVISIYCTVSEKIAIPDLPGYSVEGISIHLDDEGNILSVKTHVQTD